MALAGLPEELAIQVREARPKKVLERERRRRLEEGGQEPSAEAMVELRIAALDALLRAVRGTSGALAAAGRELKRASSSARADPAFQRAMDGGDSTIAKFGAGFLQACTSLGTALAGLSQGMAAEPIEALQEAKRVLRADSAAGIAEMAQLEEQEAACVKAVKEAAATKERLAAELGSLTQDREAFEQGSLTGWLRKPSRTRINETAVQQRNAVEELAACIDRETIARQNRKHGNEAFLEKLRKVEARSGGHIRAALELCSTSWGDTAQALQDAAKQLRANPDDRPATLAASARATDHRPGFLERFIPKRAAPPTMDFLKRTLSGDGTDGSLLECPSEEGEEDERKASPRSNAKPSHDGAATHSKDCGPASGAGGPESPLRLCFGADAQKLGFEILWDDGCPTILRVASGGEAERAGVVAGMVLKEINGLPTHGRGRTELMPLLRVRPLRLMLE